MVTIKRNHMKKRIRHTCTECGKKKEEQYMKIVGTAFNGFDVWKCNDCKDENRLYGQNERLGRRGMKYRRM